MKKTPPHKGEGHRARLRERFLNSGLDGFQDYEVIELFLTLATPRKDCKDAAKAALKRFKTLQGVLEAPVPELCEVEGIGPTNVFGVKLIGAACERYLEKRLIQKDPIHNSQQLFEYLYQRLRDKQQEHFLVIFLDSKNCIITTDTFSRGTVNASSVYPREVIRAALQHNAAALIFAHNHPSGDPQPSSEDIAITRQLLFAGNVMGIAVHEHLIIGDNRYFSFADQGRIAQMKREFESLRM
jgi:DNA repair protein RadC